MAVAMAGLNALRTSAQLHDGGGHQHVARPVLDGIDLVSYFVDLEGHDGAVSGVLSIASTFAGYPCDCLARILPVFCLGPQT